MAEFNLLAATRTIEKSMPFVLYRLLICGGAGLGYLLAALAGAGTLIGFASFSSNPGSMAPIGASIGLAIFGFANFKLRPVWLRALNAAHLSLLAQHAKGTQLPEGKAQVDFAKTLANERFPAAKALFELDGDIKQALADLADTKSTTGQGGWQAKLTRWIFALNHKTVLAWHAHGEGRDLGSSALTVLPRLARAYPTVMRYRIYAGVFEIIGFIAMYFSMMVPINSVAADLPVSIGIWRYVFGVVFAWALTATFFEPIAEAVMMQFAFSLPDGGTDDAAEAETLRQGSAGFRRIAEAASTTEG